MSKIERVILYVTIIVLTIYSFYLRKKIKITEKLAIELINDLDDREKKIDKLITELIQLKKQ